MEIKIIVNSYHHRVVMVNSRGTEVSWLTLTRERYGCFYSQLKGVLLPPNGSVLYLSDFGTLRRYRHNGYGKELMKYALEEYSSDIIYLGVSSCDNTFSNDDLIKFYESVGFKKIMYELPYQFMVYDKLGKIKDSDLVEKVVKITPELTWKNTTGSLKRYNLNELTGISTKTVLCIGSCSLLKHRRHVGYCQLFRKDFIMDKETGAYKFELHPLCDNNGNEILVKWNRDEMNVYVSRFYRGDDVRYELEIDSKDGIDT